MIGGLRTHLGCVRIVGTLSYADYDMVLELHARRADPERPQALCGQAAAHVVHHTRSRCYRKAGRAGPSRLP